MLRDDIAYNYSIPIGGIAFQYAVVIEGLRSLRYLEEPGPVLSSIGLEGIFFYGAKSSHANLGFYARHVTYDLPVELHRHVYGLSPLTSLLHLGTCAFNELNH